MAISCLPLEMPNCCEKLETAGEDPTTTAKCPSRLYGYEEVPANLK